MMNYTTMGSQSPIAELNNMAVVLTTQEDFGQAINVYQVALQQLMPKLSWQEFPPDDGDSEVILHVVQVGDAGACNAQVTTSCSLYNRAFLIDATNGAAEKTEAFFGLAATVIYNTALMYHVASLPNSSISQHERYAKALRLYEMAISILGGRAFQDSNKNTYLLKLALLNNIAQIHATNFNQIETQAWIETLKRCLQESLPNSSAGDATLRHDLHFFMNVVFVLSQHAHAPVA